VLKLGSKKKPVTVRLQIWERASDISEIGDRHAWRCFTDDEFLGTRFGEIRD